MIVEVILLCFSSISSTIDETFDFYDFYRYHFDLSGFAIKLQLEAHVNNNVSSSI